MTRVVAMAFLAALVVLVARAPAAGPPPLVGTNYSHFGLAGCSIDGYGILAGGETEATRIRQQLAAMRASGIETLRLIVWHMRDAGGHQWGVVSSGNGGIRGTARTNLVRYARDVRATGFKRLTVAFAPMWTNDPIGFGENRWDPSLFAENWSFIRDVRALVKQNGPVDTRFDLLNEGAPSDHLATKAQLADYDARIYAAYVDAFGNQDVTISSIVGANDQSRIANLVDALASTGRPLPTWFEVHDYGATLLESLRATERTLAAKGLDQPLVLGETTYNDGVGAAALKAFHAESSRLTEVMQWPLAANSTCEPLSATPPYSAASYVEALTGARAPMTLTAAVGPGARMTVRTAYGTPLVALRAGAYTLTVTDTSSRESFHLTGPRVDRKTTVPGRRTAIWSLSLRPGVYRYRSDRAGSKLGGRLTVLAGG
jgi:hypothetical protein